MQCGTCSAISFAIVGFRVQQLNIKPNEAWEIMMNLFGKYVPFIWKHIFPLIKVSLARRWVTQASQCTYIHKKLRSIFMYRCWEVWQTRDIQLLTNVLSTVTLEYNHCEGLGSFPPPSSCAIDVTWKHAIVTLVYAGLRRKRFIPSLAEIYFVSDGDQALCYAERLHVRLVLDLPGQEACCSSLARSTGCTDIFAMGYYISLKIFWYSTRK
jgi:hypothetical protein